MLAVYLCLLNFLPIFGRTLYIHNVTDLPWSCDPNHLQFLNLAIMDRTCACLEACDACTTDHESELVSDIFGKFMTCKKTRQIAKKCQANGVASSVGCDCLPFMNFVLEEHACMCMGIGNYTVHDVRGFAHRCADILAAATEESFDTSTGLLAS